MSASPIRKQVRRTAVWETPITGERGSSGLGKLGRTKGTGRPSLVGTICATTFGDRSARGDDLVIGVSGLVKLVDNEEGVERFDGVYKVGGIH